MIRRLAIHDKTDCSGWLVAIPISEKTNKPMNRYVCIRNTVDVNMLEYDDFFEIEERDRKIIGQFACNFRLDVPIKPTLTVIDGAKDNIITLFSDLRRVYGLSNREPAKLRVVK